MPPNSHGQDQVIEYVLYEGTGDHRQGRFSDADFDVVTHRRTELKLEALKSGRSIPAFPAFSITERVVTYPLDGDGKRQALGSTCEERDL